MKNAAKSRAFQIQRAVEFTIVPREFLPCL